jgi:NAD(P)-dependent dehydrogenase (short-subunit alcohol dehydrogenase family)
LQLKDWGRAALRNRHSVDSHEQRNIEMPRSDLSAGLKRLAGRNILITGAASGIGQSIATLFRAEGATLALIDCDEKRLQATARELDALPLTLDLAQAEGIEAAVGTAAQALDGLDGIVNCAGIGVPIAIEDTGIAELARFIAVNLTAPYLICRAALPYLRAVQGATIVNIASGQGLLPSAPNNTAYAATKGGLITFSKSLAVEAAPNVRVNAVCPGITRTQMAQFFFEDLDDPAEAPFLQNLAIRRPAEPVEIANAVLFLTSHESSFVTGVALAVDGGRTLH